jgi:hypothetical protein
MTSQAPLSEAEPPVSIIRGSRPDYFLAAFLAAR